MAKQARKHLRLVEVDDASGELVGFVDSDALQALQAENRKLREDLAAAERDLRAKRRRITELERDRMFERLEHPDREFIKRVAVYWHRKCRDGRPRIDPLAPNRFDAVAALAEMQGFEMVEVDGKLRRERKWRYEAEHFKAAIDGAAYDPFVTTHRNGKQEHHNDLAQICKDVTRFERFIAKAPYEPVPLATFTRLNPVEVARAREARDNRERGFHVCHQPSVAPGSEVPYGQFWLVGGSDHRLSRHAEAVGVPRFRLRLGCGGEAFPASWA